MVLTKLIVRAVFGIIGNFISFGLFASSVPTFYRVIKSNSVKEVKPELLLLTMLNCLFWVLYSTPFVHPGNILLLTANGFGVVMHLAYLIIFLLYARDNKQRMCIGGVFLIELAVTGLISGLVIGVVHNILKRRFLIGLFCNYCAEMKFLLRGFHAVADKSADYMPFPVVVTNTLNDLCWMIYASLRFDFMLLYAYCFGFLAGVVQLTRHGNCIKIPLKFTDDKKLATADVQLQGIVIVDAHEKLVREHIQANLQQIEKCDDKKQVTAAPGIVAV